MVAVRWAPRARRDIRLIQRYIGRDSVRAANETAERLVRSVDVLSSFPRQGRVVPEYADESIRELIVSNYRVIYRLRGETAVISAIMHASRDIQRHLYGRL